jgi:hypothetical protein
MFAPPPHSPKKALCSIGKPGRTKSHHPCEVCQPKPAPVHSSESTARAEVGEGSCGVKRRRLAILGIPAAVLSIPDPSYFSTSLAVSRSPRSSVSSGIAVWHLGSPLVKMTDSDRCVGCLPSKKLQDMVPERRLRRRSAGDAVCATSRSKI